MVAKTTGKQRPGFQPGQSGNPKGRPQGSRHKATLAAQVLLDGEAEALTRRCVELALEGDVTALRLCLERLLPPRKDSPVTMTMPVVKDAQDLPKITGAILRAVGRGQLTPDEAERLAAIVVIHGKTLDAAHLEARLAALEQAQEQTTTTQTLRRY